MSDASNTLSGASNGMVDEIYTSESILCMFCRFHTFSSCHNVMQLSTYTKINISCVALGVEQIEWQYNM